MSISAKEFKEAVLMLHNKLRAQVARGELGNHPGATNMNKLQHSCALATIAQEWAEYLCTNKAWDHRDEMSDTSLHAKEKFAAQMTSTMQGKTFTISGTPYVGENLAASSAQPSLEILLALAQSWYDEYKDFTFREGQRGITPAPETNLMTGHYTALIWANTRFVGCGYTACSTDGAYGTYLVCNYFTGGNMHIGAAGSAPYLGGTECTSCPADRGNSCPTTKGYKGLCDGCMATDWSTGGTTAATCDAAEQELKALNCGDTGYVSEVADFATGGDMLEAVPGDVVPDSSTGGNSTTPTPVEASGALANKLSGSVIAGIVLGVLFGNRSSLAWMLIFAFVCTVCFDVNM